ncbi:MAG: EFR1 family ferrodoxin [Clostridiales bacterium]|nr:EFR1 family ferrodoxin [Clostridiales bacterium]
MIFYFTGTGNSLDAAGRIAEKTGDKIISMSDCLKNGKMSFDIGKNENAGFVFPVYYGGLPTVVSDFIEKATLSFSKQPYVFGVITCGGSACGCGGVFVRKLSSVGIQADYVCEIKMPDNYVLLYNPMDDETAKALLERNKAEIAKIADSINSKEKYIHESKLAGRAASAFMQSAYGIFRKTAKFYADESCISCGECAKNCPEQAIEIRDGKPKWIKSRCAHCTACISRCPVKAIQYGEKTRKRNRYVNPVLK